MASTTGSTKSKKTTAQRATPKKGTTAAQKKAAAAKRKAGAAHLAKSEHGTAAVGGKAAARKAAKKDLARTMAAQALGDLNAAEMKKKVAAVAKDPTSVPAAMRAELHARGLVAQGLKGKALALWLESGETPAETVKKNPAASKPGKAATPRKSTGKRGGKLTVNAAMGAALAEGPQEIEALAAAVGQLRGNSTTRGTVVSAVKWGLDPARKWYTRTGDKVALTTATSAGPLFSCRPASGASRLRRYLPVVRNQGVRQYRRGAERPRGGRIWPRIAGAGTPGGP